MSYLSRNPAMNEYIMLNGEIPPGFGGIKQWIPVWKTLYQSDDAGTISHIWNADQVTFVPNVDQPDKMTWWRAFEGSFPVPRSIEVQRDPMGALGNFETAFGMFMYASVSANPPGITVHHGDVFLPALRNEKAVFLATVAF